MIKTLSYTVSPFSDTYKVLIEDMMKDLAEGYEIYNVTVVEKIVIYILKKEVD